MGTRRGILQALLSESNQESNIKDYGFFAGQSNLAGRGPVTDLTGDLLYLKAPIILESNTAYIRNRALTDTNTEIIEAGVNTSDTSNMFGIQPEIAYRMLEYKKKNYNMIQCAYGGTPISNYVYGSNNFSWLTQVARELRYQLRDNNQILRIPYFVWIQGESNAGDLSTYKETLIQMISDYRLRLGQPDMVFIIGQMIDCQTAVPNLAQLQQIQLEVSQEVNNCLLIPKTLATNTCVDPLHWSTNYYISAGNYVFEQIKDI